MHYYNDNDPACCAWLRELIKQGQLPQGHVDDRSITDINAADLDGYTQCHFFAGIGGWPLALRLAGWPESRPVWTGSCPCQPFSTAGRQRGFFDRRHLFPEFRRLIKERRPPVVFGEQVASRLGRAWLSGVLADLEELGYAAAAADLCAAGIGAPHIRQRLYWVANAEHDAGCAEYERKQGPRIVQGPHHTSEHHNACVGLAYADMPDENGRASGGEQSIHDEDCGADGLALSIGFGRDARGSFSGSRTPALHAGQPSAACGVGNTRGEGLEGHSRNGDVRDESGRDAAQAAGHSPATGGAWNHFHLLECSDGKARRIEPGIAPLAHGVSGRMAVRRTIQRGATEIQEEHEYSRLAALRGFGNAIVPPLASEFITAFMRI